MALNWKQITISKFGTTDADLYARINRGRVGFVWCLVNRRGKLNRIHGRANSIEEAKAACEAHAAIRRQGLALAQHEQAAAAVGSG